MAPNKMVTIKALKSKNSVDCPKIANNPEILNNGIKRNPAIK
jgi:hypothetical protein